MAIAGRWLAARYNRPGFELFDYNVYVLASDGDMMEGVTSEAASIAGHLRLSNLCWIYDDNRITIEGSTSLAFSEDVGARFAAYGWRVEHVDDANDLRALSAALERFRAAKTGPTLIVVRSHIAYGAPHAQDTHEAHGAPLGEDEIRATKQAYGWPADAHFLVPEEARQNFAQPIAERGAKLRTAWEELRRRYAREFPAESAQLDLIARGELPKHWDAGIPSFPADAKGTATRNSSGKVLGAVAEKIPWFLGGSADLAPSTKTLLSFDGAGTLAADTHGGRNMHFGIREHGMGAVLNGMALSGLRPYGATFLVFSDYMRGSIRLAAIMKLGVLYVFTHDSIGVGEDGPTHQPIEHYAALRAIPHLVVIRPGDANEVAEAYRSALSLRQPTALLLSRQNVPTLDRTKYASASGAARGAYVMADSKGGAPQVILIGTGTELYLCVAAYEQLSAAGVRARLVSMPSWELFEMQSEAYRNEVFPPAVTARVAVEVGVRQGWDRYIGRKGRYVGLDDFGASAPAEEIYADRGITVERIVAEARAAANES
jgi:transketolase